MPPSTPPLSFTLVVEGSSIIRTGMRCAAWLFAFWMMFSSLRDVALHRPEALEGMASVVRAFALDRWVYVLTVGVATVAWYTERSGKKRAIREKGKYQGRAEGNLPGRTSSGLTDTGETPQPEGMT